MPVFSCDLGKRAEGDIPSIQQGRRGLYLCWGAQICYDTPPGQGHDDDDDEDDDVDDIIMVLMSDDDGELK